MYMLANVLDDRTVFQKMRNFEVSREPVISKALFKTSELDMIPKMPRAQYKYSDGYVCVCGPSEVITQIYLANQVVSHDFSEDDLTPQLKRKFKKHCKFEDKFLTPGVVTVTAQRKYIAHILYLVTNSISS